MRFRRQFYPPLDLLIVLVGFVLISTIYSFATPIFEASDEIWHFGMVEVIRETGELPVQDADGPSTPWAQEGSQPPLYYALLAALTLPFNLDDIETLRYHNPHAKLGVPGIVDNKNMIVHDSLPVPPEGAASAVYAGRIFSVLLGLVTISAVYLSARLIAPGTVVPLLAAGITAFNPMFIFIATSVNNDNLVTALNSLAIYLMLYTLCDGFDTRRSVLLALLIAFATLSKLSGLVLVPVVAACGLWVTYRRRDVRGLFVLGTLMVIAWGLIAGWWYLRNLNLYGELFGTATMVAVAGPREGGFTLETLLQEFEGFRIAYWGLFGAVNVLTVDVFYTIMDALSVLAAVGVAIYLWRLKAGSRPFALAAVVALCTIFVIGSISLISWTAQTYASQGRLLFPFVAATSPLLAIGWQTGLRGLRIHSSSLAFAGVGALATFAFLVPFVSIMPVYALPQPTAGPPVDARPVYATYGDMTLVAYQTPDARYTPGDLVPMTLYWHTHRATQTDYSLFIHLIDEAGNVIGKVDTFPGGGRLRTSTWEPDAIYKGEYDVPIEEEIGRTPLRLQVGWWDRETGENLPATDTDGQPLSIVLDGGAFVGDPSIDEGAYTNVDDVAFGDLVVLRGYQLDGTRLVLLWEGLATPPTDLRVFVQVVDETGAIIGQGDAPPYLPTVYWRADELYRSEHTIRFVEATEAGTYPIVIGWYDPTDFSRLSTGFPDNAYPLTEIAYRSPAD